MVSMALVLGRKPGESVLIGDGIRVTVIKTEDSQLRLRIEAPKDVRIMREEIANIDIDDEHKGQKDLPTPIHGGSQK
jgi:carbon storage regulator